MNTFTSNTTNHRRAVMFIAAALFGAFTSAVLYQVPLAVQEFIFPGLVGLGIFEVLFRTRDKLSLKTLPLYMLVLLLPIQLTYSLLYNLVFFGGWDPLASLQYLFTTFPYNLYFVIETLVVIGFAYYLVKVYKVEDWEIQKPTLPAAGSNEPVFASEKSEATPAPQKMNSVQAGVGFILWFVVAGIFAPGSFGFITTPLTIIVLIVFARLEEYKSVSGGILAAVGVNFFISLVRGMTLNAVCFMPFFIESF